MKYFALFASVSLLSVAAYAADIPVPEVKPKTEKVSAEAGDQVGTLEQVDLIAPVAVVGSEAKKAEDKMKAEMASVDAGKDAKAKDALPSAENAEPEKKPDAAESADETKPDQEKDVVGIPAKKPYDKPYVGDQVVYKAKYEDTFVQLARDNDLGFVEMRAANPYVDPWLPGEGTEIILPKRHLLPDATHDGIVINLPEMRFYAYLDPNEPPVTHPIGIGREGLQTPTGTTEIVRKKEGPSWHPTARMREENPDLPYVVEAGPENPLGTHALYLGWPEYALHGTNRPYGIGRRVSSGCIRLYPEDIKSFFRIVPVGTKVTVINQPIKAAWIGDEFYVEAHLTMKQADIMEDEGGLPSYDFSDDDMNEIVKAAGDQADKMDWRLIRDVVRKRAGYPVKIYTRPQIVVDGKGDDANANANADEKPAKADKS